MNENENTVEQNALTQDANVEQPNVVEENQNVPKTYTSEQVSDLMKKRIERSHNAIFNRYGVKSFEELDEICKNYRNQVDDFGKITAKNSELVRENSFLKNNIDPEKYNDIIAYFKGNNIEFSNEELVKALETHQEWLKKTPLSTTIKKMIGFSQNQVQKETDEERRKRTFGV